MCLCSAKASTDAPQLKAEQHSTTALDGPSSTIGQLPQVQSLTRAYSHLATEEPYLPPPTSVLPSLLAERAILRQVESLQSHIPTLHASLTTARRHLTDEGADLRDNHALADALQSRISALDQSARQTQRPTPEQTARRLIDAARTQAKAHEKETRRLTRALVRFIDADLGPKLAAEELGGPVAGSVQDVAEDDLVAGYAASGRPRKKAAKPIAEDKRQRRIDEIWGPPPQDDDGFDGEARSEGGAAAAEMRDLVERLLNVAAENGGDAEYVELSRDSAAARFLVRANVAMLHRADARRIRLMEFGREADD